MKAIRIAAFVFSMGILLTSCVVVSHPYRAHWVPGHWEQSSYGPQWVKAHRVYMS